MIQTFFGGANSASPLMINMLILVFWLGTKVSLRCIAEV